AQSREAIAYGAGDHPAPLKSRRCISDCLLTWPACSALLSPRRRRVSRRADSCLSPKPRGERPGASASLVARRIRQQTTMPAHRRLGRELERFATAPLGGAGLPYWLPAGAAVRHALEEYIRELERRAGYQHVYSPVLGKRELYEISGHWAHYRADMYPPMDMGGEQVVLRPSLCPHHAVIYRARGRSYRELPLRLAEIGGQYRAELSGVLGGLSRVRAMQLNDAHVFCTVDQAADEALAALRMIARAYRALGIEPVRYRLSLPGPGGKYVDDPNL